MPAEGAAAPWTGAGERAPRAPPTRPVAAPTRRLRAPPCRLGKKVGPNPDLFAFQAQRGRPLGSGVRAPSRVEEEHGPRTCTRRTPRPPPPRPALAPALRARRPGCSRRGSGTCRPRPAPKGAHARRHGLGRDRGHAPALGRAARAARAARARARRGTRRTWPRIEKLRILPAVSVVLYRDSPIEDSSKLGQNSQFLNS